MYSLAPLLNGSLMALLILLVSTAQLANCFHVYDIATNAVLKRDAESILMSSAVSETDEQRQPSSSRLKRYTEFQENALAICCGHCMYSFRATYSTCYDLCNWNGLTPSPWQRYERQHPQASMTGRPTNDIHRVLTPRFGQREGTGGRTSAPRLIPTRSGKAGGRRQKGASGRRRKPGARRNVDHNETCTCVRQS